MKNCFNDLSDVLARRRPEADVPRPQSNGSSMA